ncbi:MAG: hypothetical protein K8R87_03695 [Verrucomicrobia bacterium]|nr:hypothetical protein [Verrucomicrobiota bacterium]
MKQRFKALANSIVGADQPAPRWLCVLVCLALVALTFWYVRTAVAHGQARNTVVEYNDQRVYLRYANSFTTPGFITPRMRMPLYGGVLSLAAPDKDAGFDMQKFFQTAKKFNIGLSLVCLLVMFLFLRRWLGDWFGLCLILVAAFQLYMLRSAYVQPEILLTSIITITIAQLIETLRHPRWWNAVLSGLLLCAWFLTKASAQGVLGIFGVILIAKWLTAPRGGRRQFFIAGVLVLASYLIPMSPYLYTSWKIFGSPFYNAQSKYFMWGETEDDKHYLQSLHLDVDLSELPADTSKLPSAKKYLQKHTTKEIKGRLYKGMDVMFKLAFTDYTLLYFMVAFWSGIMLWAFCRRWPDGIFALWKCRWEAFFVVSFLGVFIVLFGWFTPIHVGPRLIASITIAALFICIAVSRWMLRDDVAIIGGVQVSLEKLVATGFIILWAMATLMQAPADMAIGFFAG